MSTLRGFLDDLMVKPSRDTALIFADWLDDVGGEPERAALIRECVKTGGAVRKRKAFRPWVASLTCYADRLASEKAHGWLYGLVCGLYIYALDWVLFGPSLVQRHPIQYVGFRGLGFKEAPWFCERYIERFRNSGEARLKAAIAWAKEQLQ